MEYSTSQEEQQGTGSSPSIASWPTANQSITEQGVLPGASLQHDIIIQPSSPGLDSEDEAHIDIELLSQQVDVVTYSHHSSPESVEVEDEDIVEQIPDEEVAVGAVEVTVWSTFDDQEPSSMESDMINQSSLDVVNQSLSNPTNQSSSSADGINDQSSSNLVDESSVDVIHSSTVMMDNQSSVDVIHSSTADVMMDNQSSVDVIHSSTADVMMDNQSSVDVTADVSLSAAIEQSVDNDKIQYHPTSYGDHPTSYGEQPMSDDLNLEVDYSSGQEVKVKEPAGILEENDATPLLVDEDMIMKTSQAVSGANVDSQDGLAASDGNVGSQDGLTVISGDNGPAGKGSNIDSQNRPAGSDDNINDDGSSLERGKDTNTSVINTAVSVTSDGPDNPVTVISGANTDVIDGSMSVIRHQVRKQAVVIPRAMDPALEAFSHDEVPLIREPLPKVFCQSTDSEEVVYKVKVLDQGKEPSLSQSHVSCFIPSPIVFSASLSFPKSQQLNSTSEVKISSSCSRPSHLQSSPHHGSEDQSNRREVTPVLNASYAASTCLKKNNTVDGDVLEKQGVDSKQQEKDFLYQTDSETGSEMEVRLESLSNPQSLEQSLLRDEREEIGELKDKLEEETIQQQSEDISSQSKDSSPVSQSYPVAPPTHVDPPPPSATNVSPPSPIPPVSISPFVSISTPPALPPVFLRNPRNFHSLVQSAIWFKASNVQTQNGRKTSGKGHQKERVHQKGTGLQGTPDRPKTSHQKSITPSGRNQVKQGSKESGHQKSRSPDIGHSETTILDENCQAKQSQELTPEIGPQKSETFNEENQMRYDQKLTKAAPQKSKTTDISRMKNKTSDASHQKDKTRKSRTHLKSKTTGASHHKSKTTDSSCQRTQDRTIDGKNFARSKDGHQKKKGTQDKLLRAILSQPLTIWKDIFSTGGSNGESSDPNSALPVKETGNSTVEEGHETGFRSSPPEEECEETGFRSPTEEECEEVGFRSTPEEEEHEEIGFKYSSAEEEMEFRSPAEENDQQERSTSIITTPLEEAEFATSVVTPAKEITGSASIIGLVPGQEMTKSSLKEGSNQLVKMRESSSTPVIVLASDKERDSSDRCDRERTEQIGVIMGASDQRGGASDQRGGASDQRGGASDQRGGASDQRGGALDQKAGTFDRDMTVDEKLQSKVYKGEPQSREIDEGEFQSRETVEEEPHNRKIDNEEPRSKEIDDGELQSSEMYEGEPQSREIDDGELQSREMYEGEPQSREIDEGELQSREMYEGELQSREMYEGEPQSKEIDDGELQSREMYEGEPQSREMYEGEPQSREISEAVDEEPQNRKREHQKREMYGVGMKSLEDVAMDKKREEKLRGVVALEDNERLVAKTKDEEMVLEDSEGEKDVGMLGKNEVLEGSVGEVLEGRGGEVLKGRLEGSVDGVLEDSVGKVVEDSVGEVLEGSVGEVVEDSVGEVLEGSVEEVVEGSVGEVVEGSVGEVLEGSVEEVVESSVGGSVGEVSEDGEEEMEDDDVSTCDDTTDNIEDIDLPNTMIVDVKGSQSPIIHYLCSPEDSKLLIEALVAHVLHSITWCNMIYNSRPFQWLLSPLLG